MLVLPADEATAAWVQRHWGSWCTMTPTALHQLEWAVEGAAALKRPGWTMKKTTRCQMHVVQALYAALQCMSKDPNSHIYSSVVTIIFFKWKCEVEDAEVEAFFQYLKCHLYRAAQKLQRSSSPASNSCVSNWRSPKASPNLFIPQPWDSRSSLGKWWKNVKKKLEKKW